ncbi:MAG: VWA domain-containing protein [Ignavibacteriales bacterium]|nr:VWA domain-containing protein [Ignavibacteriales bacterium]
MKLTVSLIVLIFSLLPLSLNNSFANEKPKVQLAILLDTSNSMDGLIDQAKTQLWKIVNELALSKKNGQSIELNVALYEYGNDGLKSSDGYVRMITNFTTDLDLISDELFKLKTFGGEEFCGTVIDSAIQVLNWSTNNEDLKLIFIAGNEEFTQGHVDYKKSCKEAISKGVIVNTIFCGDYNEGVQTFWKDGADLADGNYINIDQNQQIAFIEAPQDEELNKLGQEINATYIGYGSYGEERVKMQEQQDANALGVNSEVLAQRNMTKGSGQYINTDWDLVDAVNEGVVEIEKIKDEDLPENMKNMTLEEREQYVEQQTQKRKGIQERIQLLSEERRKYIAQKMLDENTNTLDAAILKTVRDQAVKQNFTFEQ